MLQPFTTPAQTPISPNPSTPSPPAPQAPSATTLKAPAPPAAPASPAAPPGVEEEVVGEAVGSTKFKFKVVF